MKYRAQVVKTVKWTEEVEAASMSEAEDLLAQGKGEVVRASGETEFEEIDYDTLEEVP